MLCLTQALSYSSSVLLKLCFVFQFFLVPRVRGVDEHLTTGRGGLPTQGAHPLSPGKLARNQQCRGLMPKVGAVIGSAPLPQLLLGRDLHETTKRGSVVARAHALALVS